MSESDDPRYKLYLEQRQEYAKLAAEHLTRFERSVLLASGAGFAGLFSLIANDKLQTSSVSIISAIFFSASFGFMLLGHYFSYLDNEQAISSLDTCFEQQTGLDLKRKWFSLCIEPLNITSMISLVFGYVALGVSIICKG